MAERLAGASNPVLVLSRNFRSDETGESEPGYGMHDA